MHNVPFGYPVDSPLARLCWLNVKKRKLSRLVTVVKSRWVDEHNTPKLQNGLQTLHLQAYFSRSRSAHASKAFGFLGGRISVVGLVRAEGEWYVVVRDDVNDVLPR